MDLQTILFSALGVVVTAIVGWAAERLVAFLNSKLENTKYAKHINGAVDIVTRAVKTTYQTYVESLKGDNIFTAEAQTEALSKAGKLAIEQMTQDTQAYIANNFGNVEQWVSNTIESVIYDLKNNSNR